MIVNMKKTLLPLAILLVFSACKKDSNRDYRCDCRNGSFTPYDSLTISASDYTEAYNKCKGRESKWRQNTYYSNATCDLK